MEWLHFSDFHFGGKEGPQHEAMKSLIDYLNDSFNRTPCKVDAIFLVGDIAYSGQASEYARFEGEFLKPLLGISALNGAKIFAVPGNHDADCDAATPMTWPGIRDRNQQIVFCENHEGQKFRKPRAEVFRNYWDFIQRNKIISPNPLQEISLLMHDTDMPFDVITLNTALFSDKDDRSDAPITPCPLSSLRERLTGLGRDRPVLVLGHHPQSCFLKEHQRPFDTLLVDNHVVYLHGHEHAPTVLFNADGTVRSLGFGATYVNPLGNNTLPPYRNSFLRCKLGENLQLTGYNWDSVVGKWDEATKEQFSSCITTKTYDGKSLKLNVPLINVGSNIVNVSYTLESIPRKSPQPQSIIPMSKPSVRVWLKLLALGENVYGHFKNSSESDVQTSQSTDGKIEFCLERANERDLLICIPATTHILSAKEIESYNTRLDTENIDSVTVITFGIMSSEARDMYLKLKIKKDIEILSNQEITAKWHSLFSAKQRELLSSLDAGSDTVRTVIDDDEIYLLVVHANDRNTFSLISAKGELLEGSHAVVAKLREADPDLYRMGYSSEQDGVSNGNVEKKFDEPAYLEKCYKEANKLKYAALANVGLRLPDASLEDVYVEASASEVCQSSHVDDLLDDHLSAYPVSDKLKEQIKQQFVKNVAGDDRHETSRARLFCQQYGAVLLTGDPGSGKTCFVNSEILAYARRGVPDASSKICSDEWHSVHLPIFVQLSQAAAESDLGTVGLIMIASRLLERRGFTIPADELNALLKQGRLALFFDGLDEVVSVEKRALVVQHINELVTDCLPLGNRIVVTSRPAAINVVNLLPTLRQLELKGLTESEISTLAHRILSLRLTETPDGVVVDAGRIRDSDSALVSRLLHDCAIKPGVARFASNPLLLTLIVLTYANSGAPSAKRHLIYEEAVKTLASVRGRQAGHDPMSLQDLRMRLGAVALSVYRKESGFLPTRAEVNQIIRGVMTRQMGVSISDAEANEYIQKVAESTGLIAIGGGDGAGDASSIVTFMHHSFMEYFAAVGLSQDIDAADLATLVTQPRWVEILTLLAGLIGERDDIAPVLARLVNDGSNYGAVDARYLLFALDCALECEVPSEAAILLLSAGVQKCVVDGPARTDPWVRSEIGGRLQQLMSACGASTFEKTLCKLINDSKADVCAAAILLASHACMEDIQSDALVAVVDKCCTRYDEAIQVAICEAASRAKMFRTPLVLQSIAKSLRKSVATKRAALDAIYSIPGMAAKNWEEIINGLGEKQVNIRRLASKAAIQAGLDGDLATLSDNKKDLVANALQYMCESGLGLEYPNGKVQQSTIERLLKSALLRDRLIGIQMMPAQDSGGDVVARKLMEIVDANEDHQEVTAALRAFRSSPDARLMIKDIEFRRIFRLSEDGTADVRRASIQLLSCFNSDMTVVKMLKEKNFEVLSIGEYEAVWVALGRAQVLKDEIGEVIERELENIVSENAKLNETYVSKVCAVLDAARNLGRNLRFEINNLLARLIDDFKQDDRVRKAAIRAYAATAIPSMQVVDYISRQLRTPSALSSPEICQTLSIFARNCRQSVEYVLACVETLPTLRDAAENLHAKMQRREFSADTEYLVTELRNGITEINQIVVTFEEFIKTDSSSGGYKLTTLGA